MLGLGMGMLPFSPGCSCLGALPEAGGGGRGVEVSEWELERFRVVLGLETQRPEPGAHGP